MGRASSVDSIAGGCGYGVFIGGEKEKLPVVGIGLFTDQLRDLFHGVIFGCIFITIGINGDDDFGGTLGFRRFGEFFPNVVDRVAYGIEE